MIAKFVQKHLTYTPYIYIYFFHSFPPSAVHDFAILEILMQKSDNLLLHYKDEMCHIHFIIVRSCIFAYFAKVSDYLLKT